MEHAMEELEQLYQDCLEKIKAAASNRKFGDGILGFGKKMSDEPCHMELLQGVKRLAEEMSQSADPQQASKVIRFIFERPAAYGKIESSMYWTMLVAHGQAMSLISCLNGEDAKAICEWYQKENPKRTRLPVQNDIVKALEKKYK